MKTLLGVTREHFPQLLVDCRFALGAEIGVAQGHHAVHLLKNWPGKLILVDCWKHQDNPDYCDSASHWTDADHEVNFQETLRNVAEFGDRARIVRALSHAAAMNIAHESLDFVYHDANHSRRAMAEDLPVWYQRVRSGGMISGHDFVDSGYPFGVKTAVLEFIEALDCEVDLYVAEEEWPTWHFFKP